MDSDNEKAQNVARKDVLNDKGDASTLESPSDQMLTATDAMYDLMLGQCGFFYPDGSVETGTWELGIKLKGKTPKTTDAVSLDLDFKQMTTQPGPDEYAEDELVYEGETNTSRMMHGFGTLRSKSFTYEGFFREGLFSGVGRFQRSNGNLYIGQFEKGVAHGVGLLNVNGTIFLGKFAEAKKQGRFIVSRPARRMINNEFYTDDAVDYTKAASFEDSFEGMRNDQGQRHGQGTAIFKNGDMYVGEFYKDKMHGSGALSFHTLKGVYMGEMRDDLMHGKGKLVSPEGKVQEGTWERGIKHLARRFALEPAKNAEEENARWEDLKSERSLPTYSDFISHQYHSILSVLYFRFCSRSYLPTRLLAKLLAPFFVWYGFGFCFTYTRSVWYQVLYNYWIFTVSACGVWTREARLLYSVDECLESTKTSEGGREAETDASDRWTRYSRAWASIIAPRCILFMIVPWLTPLMLYSTTMATSPLFIADPEVPLPPWLDFSSFYRRALRDSAGEEQEWIAVLDMIYLFATESRLVQTILNAYKFALSVALWQAGYHKKDLAVKYWVFSALFVFLPYCYVLALKPITYLGKTLGIKNSDLHFRTSTPSASPSPSQSPPAAASPATEGAPSDHIPRSLDRPSVVVTFGNVYSEHDGAMGGAVELRVSEAVKSPLARLDP